MYRARDVRLGRSVAIKILPPQLSEDSKLRTRFEREAKAISRLNHPNICTLYDVGEASIERGGVAHSVRYLALEYLEGQILEDRLKKGPLPLIEVMRYAMQIAEALDKAHGNQILHRDLKPANIMITKSGAKLFDFGLAKVLPSSSSDLASPISETSTPEESLTSEGSVIGTLEYLSPEQLHGREPDSRTDIFAFGVCLYQMITGRRPFHGNSRAGVIAAILEHEPDPVSVYRPETPAPLVWLVKNCLSKNPDDRIQAAHDVVLELKRVGDEVASRTTDNSSKRIPIRRRWIWTAVVVSIVLVVTAAEVLSRRKRVDADRRVTRRFSISIPSIAPLAAASSEEFAVSPDGTRIVYVAGTTPNRLYMYSLDTLEAKPLTGTDGAKGPFFSPDGQWIGFYTLDEGLKKIAVAGSAPLLLTAEHDIRGATWGADDTIVFAEPASPLRKVSAAGGRSEVFIHAEPQSDMRWPAFLPGDEAILFTRSDMTGDFENAHLIVHSMKTGESKEVLSGATYGRYVSTGHLAYLHAQAIYSVPFDLKTMTVTGPPQSRITDVDSYFTSGLAHFAVSNDGSLFYIPRDPTETDRELVWVDRSGGTTPVTPTHRSYQEVKISPDGNRLLVTMGATPRLDVWLYDIPTNGWTRLTTEATNSGPIWSPDGKEIAFASNRTGGFSLYVAPSDGATAPRLIVSRRSWDFPTSWSPDGKMIVVIEQYRTTLDDIFVVAPREKAVPTPFLSTAFDEREAVFSPDGHWIAYRSDESGREEIYVRAFPAGARKWQLSTGGGRNPIWRRDGTELFYRSDNRVMVVDTKLVPSFTAGRPRMLFKGDFQPEYDVTPDGQRFVMIKVPKPSPRTEIKVVLGLFNKQ